MKKRLVPGLCIGLALLMLTGCGGSGSPADKAANTMAIAETAAASESYYEAEVAGGGIYESVMDYEMADGGILEGGSSAEMKAVNRKLIKTVSMDVETEEFDGLVSKLENRIHELGGYIESSDVRGNSYYDDSRWSNMTIRIPSDKLDSFVNEVAEISNITWKSENVEDITLNYVDVESRKIALEIEQERLLVLLEIAESVEDIITIESRLSEVRYEMQSYASQLLVYDNQVEYSTIHLSISEVQRLTPQEEPNMLERIATGFTDNMSGAIELVENVIVAVIIMIPYWGILVIAAVMIVLVCKVVSKIRKNKTEKRKAVNAEQ